MWFITQDGWIRHIDFTGYQACITTSRPTGVTSTFCSKQFARLLAMRLADGLLGYHQV